MIEFRKITGDNFGECIKLEVNENQKNFVAPNIRSLAQAYVATSNNECIPMPYAIYDKDTMVGFIMLCYCTADETEPENTYGVWRLMIDKQHQGKGYGKETMAKAIEYIKTFPYGAATSVVLSYEPENLVAKALYAAFGFVETGVIEDNEAVAKLVL